jgi:peptidylprolyl isomerase
LVFLLLEKGVNRHMTKRWIGLIAFLALAAGPVRGETTATMAAAGAGDGNTSVTLESGVQYQDIVIGTGPEPRRGQIVSLHYTGMLLNGKVFDSSRDKLVPHPLRIPWDTRKLVVGLDEGMYGMRVGGRRIVTMPPELGYGKRGSGQDIPPDSWLKFDVELCGVKDAVETTQSATME